MKNKNNTYFLFFTILFVVVFLVLFIFAIFYTPWFGFNLTGQGKTAYLGIPRVESYVVSSDGPHLINVDLSVGFTDKNISADQDMLKTIVSGVVAGLDYTAITDRDSVEYIKTAIKDELLKYYTEDELQGVYITGLSTDFRLPVVNTDRQSLTFPLIK